MLGFGGGLDGGRGTLGRIDTDSPPTPASDESVAGKALSSEPSLRLLAMYLGLSALAIGQPILDLLGSNPEVLSASNNTGATAWVFVFALLLLPPLVTFAIVVGVSRLSPSGGALLHQVVVGLFAFLFALAVLSSLGIGIDLVAFVLAVAVSVVIVSLYRTSVGVRQVLVILGVFPLILLVQFFFSASGEALRAADPEVIEPTGDFSTPPIVFMVFDEMPLWPLLDSEGEIDSEQFPGFAALAAEATFYRNTVAPSNSTQTAVPAILTGRYAVEPPPAPFASQYPESLFTMLGGAYAMNAYESTTSLCPSGRCDLPSTSALNASPGDALRSLVRDAGIVYGHRVLPDRARSSLPRIDLGWGNFGDQAPAADVSGNETLAPSDASASADDDDLWAKLAQESEGGALRQFGIMADIAWAASAAGDATLSFYHGIVPHRPWNLSAEGVPYVATNRTEEEASDLSVDTRRDQYQRMLMMLSYTDNQVLEAITTLQTTDVWDRAMVVVVVDHGISLAPGLSERTADLGSDISINDLYRVPMFVKLPGQQTGEVSDCPALAIDVLPTIASVTGIDPGWAFDGVDLADCVDGVSRDRVSSEIYGEAAFGIDLDLDDLLGQVERYGQWVDPSHGADAFARVGSAAGMIGENVATDRSSTAVRSWTANELAEPVNGLVPAQLTGTVEIADQLTAGAEGVITADGVAIGVIAELDSAPAGEFSYSAIIDTSMLAPTSVVELLVVSADGRVEFVGPHD